MFDTPCADSDDGDIFHPDRQITIDRRVTSTQPELPEPISNFTSRTSAVSRTISSPLLNDPAFQFLGFIGDSVDQI
jgi:hypothetical protein